MCSPDLDRNLVPNNFLNRVYVCFFLSGMGSLIYEIAWLNKIQLMMGHTVYSLSTTLAAYLSGLAIGSLFSPRLKELRIIKAKGLSNLSLYLIAEVLIGIYALIFHPLLLLVEMSYNFFITHLHLSLLNLSFVQFIFCGGLLFIPTFLMGTTLPLLSEALYPQKNEVSEKISFLYGINSFGALIGCFLGGFFIIPRFGYFKSILFAAAINFLLFFYMNFFYFRECPVPSIVSQDPVIESLETQKYKKCDLILLFTSGFSSVIVQIIWNRLASLVFGPSVYIFTIITMVVLLGIVLASLKLKWFIRESQNKKDNHLLPLLPMVIAASLLVSNYLLSRLPELVLFFNQKANPGFSLRVSFELISALFVLLPAATFLGVLFPSAISNLTKAQGGNQASQFVGLGYAFNVFGMISGAIIGSFILLPWLGVEDLSYWVEGSLCLLSIVMLLYEKERIQTVLALIGIALISFLIVPNFNWSILTSGYFYNRFDQVSSDSLYDYGWSSYVGYFSNSNLDLIDKKDDPYGTISIHHSDHSVTFKMDGKVDGSIDSENQYSNDSKTTRLLALYPALIRPDASSALIIGLGTGQTAAQVLQFPKMKKLKVIEISAAMIDFSKKYFFSLIGGDGQFWQDSRVSIENQDGRNYLENVNESYDLIISEPPNPWVNGVASLFTVEYYQAIAKRLNPGGIASLWFHTYGLSCEAVYSVFSAVAEVFPEFIILKTSTDLYFLASASWNKFHISPIPQNASVLENTLFKIIDVNEPNLLQFVASSESPNENLREKNYFSILTSQFLYDRNEVFKLTHKYNVNRDDNQFLQYESGKTFSQKIFCRDFPKAAQLDTITKYWQP